MKESFHAPSPEQIPSHADSPRAERSQAAEAAISVQTMLALRLYHLQHPEEQVDELNPSSVDRAIRNKAMELWLDETKGASVSELFRDYFNEPGNAGKLNTFTSIPALDKVIHEILGADTNEAIH